MLWKKVLVLFLRSKNLLILDMHEKRIFLTCSHLLLLLAITCTFFSMVHLSYADVIDVPQDYPTIQQAIDAASAGDTIQVNRRPDESQSIYYERLLIGKELTLVGESRETIVVDGSGAGSVIRIQAENVEIRGFTIRNGGRKYGGIRANGFSYVTVANNTLEANKQGVVLLNSHYNTVVQNRFFNNSAEGIRLSESVGNTISDNDVSESAYGIKLSYTNSTFVLHNTVSNNSYGIYIDHSSNDTVHKNTLRRNHVDGIFPYRCHDIIVSDNAIFESAYGIQLHTSHTITVLGNNATGNSYAIYLAYSAPSNTIENNTIVGNDWGVTLYSSSNNLLKGNVLSCNTYGVDPESESDNNLVYHNNFIDNAEQVVWNPDCLNTWDDDSKGNYWSDYTGTDSNGDGIGDTPYSIDPMNRDRYPLMTPWGILHDVAVIDVTTAADEVYRGQMVNITVVVENQGTEEETFNVTTRYENATLSLLGTVGTQEVTNLAPDATVNLTFLWNTTGVQACVLYTIEAEASIIPDEIDTADNTYIDGTVKVKMPGDVDGDGTVDVADLSIVSMAYGTFVGEPNYNPDADLNRDGVVDMRDLSTVARNLGKTC